MRYVIVVALGAILASGCGDPAKRMLVNDAAREHVMDLIAKYPANAAQMTDRLIASDSLSGALVERLMANPAAKARIAERIGRDQDALDAVLAAAARDPATRAHLMGWISGMKVGAGSGTTQ